MNGVSGAFEAFIAAVSDRLGQDCVELDPSVLAQYGVHSLPAPDNPPAAVVYPGSTAEVQIVVQLANRFSVPLSPISAGQSFGLGSKAPVRKGQVLLDLGRRMNRIIEINETLGYCVVEPGVTFQDLHNELVQRGSSLMISPTAGPPAGSVLGNAVDKGGGSGPYGDHFGMSCGMEVVIGNGDIIRTGEGSLDVAAPLNWHVTKYSFGPLLDGLFTQSNYGIVTRLGIWLMKRPKLIHTFFFTFPRVGDISQVIDTIRELKTDGVVPTQIRVTSDLYLISSQESNPEYAASGGRHSLSDEARLALQQKYGVGFWIVSGAVYGSDSAGIERALQRVRQGFQRSGDVAYISHDEAQAMPILKVAINSNTGLPSDGELRMLNWRPGGGAIWFTPGSPMLGDTVDEMRAACADICRSHGLDYMASHVCGQRFARSVHAIIYNREDGDETARADQCYRAMSNVFRERGIFVGRSPTVYQQFHHQQRMSSVAQVCSAIKSVLDPNNIIAPGRYGVE